MRAGAAGKWQIQNDRSRCDPHADQGDRARAVPGSRSLPPERARSLRGVGRARTASPAAMFGALVDLAFLSPRVGSRVILHGRQPVELTATRLTETRSAARLDRSAQPPGELKERPATEGAQAKAWAPLVAALLISRGGDCRNAGQRKSSQGEPARGQARPVLWSRPGSHSRQKPGSLRWVGMEGTGETDWPAEGTGFETLGSLSGISPIRAVGAGNQTSVVGTAVSSTAGTECQTFIDEFDLIKSNST